MFVYLHCAHVIDVDHDVIRADARWYDEFFSYAPSHGFRFVSHAQDNPQRQIKIRAIFTDLVTALSFVLVLYTAFPMLPTFSGLRPMNAFIANMAPLAVPVLTVANTFLSAMFTKTYVDLNMECFADWLDRRGYPDWVCDCCERIQFLWS